MGSCLSRTILIQLILSLDGAAGLTLMANNFLSCFSLFVSITTDAHRDVRYCKLGVTCFRVMNPQVVIGSAVYIASGPSSNFRTVYPATVRDEIAF